GRGLRGVLPVADRRTHVRRPGARRSVRRRRGRRNLPLHAVPGIWGGDRAKRRRGHQRYGAEGDPETSGGSTAMTSKTMTKTDRISDLVAITSRFITCLEREVELLQAMRPQDIGPLQLDKVAMADAYEAHMRALNAAAESDETVDQALHEE